ncbi:MAG: threonylcarbamoyl-AMP synthase [Bacteroidales bacterium]|nr:threonylcarbamoyl-AMP synthase [Bacteroidales bacterium]
MLIKLYEDSPNGRDISKVVDALQDGAVVIVPTDTFYSFACSMQYKKAVETIAQLKGFSLKRAKYSMLCSSLSQLSEYVRPMDKDLFGLLRECLPGPYTFIMDANNNVPRNYQNANKTIGMRVPDNNILRAIVEQLGCPLVGTSVRRLDEETETEYFTDPELIYEVFGKRVDMVIDGGIGSDEPSTVIDCSDGQFELIRQGKGPLPDELA